MKRYVLLAFIACAGEVQAFTCQYPEQPSGLEQTLRVYGHGQHDRLGELRIGPSGYEAVKLIYDCHEQLDGAVTCTRDLDGGVTELITVTAARSLAIHATVHPIEKTKSTVSLENIRCFDK